ncbi:thiamine phosphate synthase [Marinobacter zhanjiangensis]|uniref:Thiamine-phosphate synthase n=1 Tax=Marinobacter zhanjiangensis TaxID=578215 RepID=A0ABQ3BC30_9GAMM|nr:thiamine phosphate synthase [Marinobacter zhanjiangensis]GGY83311.1 thiamine-phosphate synthase [Marinobacter zhanjiangensis]
MSTPAFSKGLRPGLYAVTDSALLPEDTLVPAVATALRGGAVLVQYREKRLDQAGRLRQGRALADLCHREGVPLIINDDPLLARDCGADGVHLGQADGSVEEARSLLGEDAIIGVTCHGRLDLAEAASRRGADYLAFGRFHMSGTKPGAPAATPDVLEQARRFGLPRTAIGGITVDNGAPLIRAGADLLAVVGGLFSGDIVQIEDRARAFTRLFAEHHPLFKL